MRKVDLPFHVLCKSSLFLALKIASIVITVIAVFFQDLAVMANYALQTEFMSYILVIPFLFVYLIYRKRKMLRAVMPLENQETKHLPTIVGIILSITAILLYWHGSYTFTPLEYHMVALPIFVTGLTFVFFNGQVVRQLAFPIAFLMFLIPPPSEILYSLGSTLSVASSEASYTLIRLLGITSTLTTEYGNPIIQITRQNGATMSFAVDIACSGIYSLTGFVIFAVFVAYIIRDKMWKKLTLFLVGFSLIYLLNITRITTILIIGYQYGEELALQLFHMAGGWVFVFIGTLLLLVFGEKILHTRIFARSTKCTECNQESRRNSSFCLVCGRIVVPAPIKFRKIESVKIAAAIVSAILLVSIQTPVFALTEGPAQIIIQTPAGEQGNIQLLPQIPGYTLTYVYRDRNYEEISGQDASLVYAYVPLNKSKESVWVAVEIGTATSWLHRWEVCLISWQIIHERPASVTQLDLKDIQILQNPPIIARYFAFQWIETNQTQVVLYWYESSLFMANETAQQKQVKISLITYPLAPQNITKTEDLLPFATTIAQYWQPIKTWSQIALLLSQNSLYLAEIASAMLPVAAIIYVLQKRKQRKAGAKACQKLSAQNKQVIDAISETEKTRKPTLHAVASTFRSKTGEPMEDEELVQRLSELEKTGIIRAQIASIQDEPTQIWESQTRLLRK